MNKVLAAVEATLWYGFFYSLLYCIKNDVNLFIGALVVLAFMYGASIACPWMRSTDAWKRMLEEQ